MEKAAFINKVLVTGATGYIGGRLIPKLLDAGYQVRVLIRGHADRLSARSWADQVEIAVGDVLKPETLAQSMDGIDAAYYLIHSMKSSDEFRERDKLAAQNFAQAAQDARVKRIIYLGGLGNSDETLSEHLQSRQETGDVLRQFEVPVTEFRAAVVVGSGSVSFEMIRHLTERLPVMICPKWVFTKVQPIPIYDLLDYLVAALSLPESADEIIEIGGADVMTYGDMMLGYAKERNLTRKLIPVPYLTPGLSSRWVHFVTPIPASIAQPLIKGLRNEVIVTNDKAKKLFPTIQPSDYATAVKRALQRMRGGDVQTVWSDALSSSRGDSKPYQFVEEQGMLIEKHTRQVDAAPTAVYNAFASLGGKVGWPPFTWLWQIRGLLDRMVGGSGLRRGRRHPLHLQRGDAVDFWRVEKVEEGACLLLQAEMKLPGRAWLLFEVEPKNSGSHLTQTAFFIPKGLWGLLYWYSVFPLHKLIFPKLIDYIADRGKAIDINEKVAVNA